MRIIILMIFLLSFIVVKSQFTDNILPIYFESDCGKWVHKDTITTLWDTIEIVNLCRTCDASWTYSQWICDYNNETYAAYCPCGCGYDIVRYRLRVNEVGIIQKQEQRIRLKYIEKTKTPFENKLIKIKNRD